MSLPPVPVALPTDQNKAIGAAGATVIGGAVATIVIHIMNKAAPGWLDPDTTGAIQTLILAGLAYAGAYLVPHSK